MHFKPLTTPLSLSLLLSLTSASSDQSKPHNANHIFNAIHSSMRQWGSSLNHNGMSFFLATVPAGTQLYHGTSKEDPIKGMEWLAFEPEHALIFARPRHMPGHPPGDGEGPPGYGPPGYGPPGDGPPDDEDGLSEEHSRHDWEHIGPPPDGHEPGSEPAHRLPQPPHHDKRPGKPKRPFDPERPGDMPPPHHPHDSLPPPPPEHWFGPPKHHEPPSPGNHKPPPPPGHYEPPSPPGHHEPPPPPGHEKARPPHHPHDAPPPPPPGAWPQPPKHHEPPNPAHRESPSSRPHHERKRNSQKPLGVQTSDEEPSYGYLHTYVPTHPLRLLYVDGLSAGKTSNGTLDTQDKLILNLTDTNGPMGGEIDRAIGMCNLTTTIWKDQIDGILRMEGGFEIILCDFQKHLERTELITVTKGEGHDGPGSVMGGWQYIKAITSRYHGIGGERVSIDYEDFVSVFAYPDVENLFNNDVQSDYAMPRLQNVKDADLIRVKSDITEMILRKDWTEHTGSKNWQAVADMVVQRYSNPIHYLHTNKKVRNDRDLLAIYLSNLLIPFIDYTARNATLETKRCIAQFVPSLPAPPRPAASLAHRTLYEVTQHICDTLLTSFSIASSPTPHSSFTSVYASHAVELIDELVEYLRWTTWKECKTCKDDDVCFIPIWPMGNHEDHANPKCLDKKGVSDRRGYWGFRWGPGPPRKGGQGGWHGRKRGARKSRSE